MATANNPEDKDNSTCAHYSCNCEVQPGETYCSEGCAQQEDEDVCACGHTECQQE